MPQLYHMASHIDEFPPVLDPWISDALADIFAVSLRCFYGPSEGVHHLKVAFSPGSPMETE